MKKLTLLEDDNAEIVKPNVANVAGFLSQLIQSEWDSVDLYNSMLLAMQEENNDEVKATLDEIISNHYINIGQLEKALQQVNPVAELIDSDTIES